MKKQSTTKNPDLIDWFLRGWGDEKKGTTSSPPEGAPEIAYTKGAKYYQEFGGPKCFLTQEGILKIINHESN
jgi:hypothetical protein